MERVYLEIICLMKEGCEEINECPIIEVSKKLSPALRIGEVEDLCARGLLRRSAPIIKVSPEELEERVGAPNRIVSYGCSEGTEENPCVGVVFFFEELPAPPN